MKKYYEAYDKRYRQIHEKGLSWSTEDSTPIVEEMIRKYSLEDEKMLEIDCGEGRDARYLLDRNYDLLAIDVSVEAIDYCMKIGMTVQATFIIGFPDETEDEVQQTVDLAKELSASLPVLNILTVLPNSEIFFTQVETNPEYHPPKRIADLIKFERTLTDNPSINLSKVPFLELKVIHHYFQWKDFSGRDSVAGDEFGIVKKLARDTFNRIFKHGLVGFFYGGFHSVKQFVTVFFYSHCFPSIMRKYGLNQE